MQMAGPDGVANVSAAHRQSGVPGIRLLDHVRRQEPQGINGAFLKVTHAYVSVSYWGCPYSSR